MAFPLINGRAYDWAQLVVKIAGANRPLVGITALNYADEQTIEKNYAAGNMPFSYGMGQIDCSGSMTLQMEEVEFLQKASPSGRIQDLPVFDIVVSFLNPEKEMVTHIIKNVKLTRNSREMETGSTGITAEIPFMCSHIDWKPGAIY
jgi:hypothetical protein